MMLTICGGAKIMSEYIESIDSPYSRLPSYREVTMTSGAKYDITLDELQKAFPDYK